MATHIVALFNDQEHAQNAVRNLTQQGLAQSNISVIAADKSGSMAQQTVDDEGNLASEGAKAGLSTGALVGAGVGVLAGIGLGFVPFLGLLVAGPVAGLLTGAAAGAATGGALGGLVGLGIPENEVERYSESVRNGGYLVIADVEDSRVDSFERILHDAGAVDIDESMTSRAAMGSTGTATPPPMPRNEHIAPAPTYQAPVSTPAPTYSAPQTETTTNAIDGNKIDVVEEELQVGKREVETGGIRVRRFMTEKPVTASVELREEHINVERHAVDRAATASDFQEGTIEVRTTAEVPVVAKEARVVEEVTIGKTADERTETVSDTVRRTDVEVEEIGTTTTRPSTDRI